MYFVKQQIHVIFSKKIIPILSVLLLGIIIGILSINKTAIAAVLVAILSLLLVKLISGRYRLAVLFFFVSFATLINALMLKYGLVDRHSLPNTIVYFSSDFIVTISLFFGIKRKLGLTELFSALFIIWEITSILSAKYILPPDSKTLLISLVVTPSAILYYYAIYRSSKFEFTSFLKIVAWFSIALFAFGIVDVLTSHKILMALGVGETISVSNVSLDNLSNTSYYQNGIPRMLSFFGSALSVGWWVCAALPLMIEASIRYKKRIYIIASLCCLIASVMSLTRMSWISIVIGGVIAFIFSRNFKGKFKLILWSLPILVIAGFSLLSSNKAIQFINDSLNGTNSSNVYHLFGIQTGEMLFRMHTLTGFGTSNSPFFSLWSPSLSEAFGMANNVNVESSILDLGIQLGIIGIIVYALFIFSTIFKATTKKDSMRKFTVLWLFISLILNCNVNYIFYNSINSLLMFGYFAFSRIESDQIKN